MGLKINCYLEQQTMIRDPNELGSTQINEHKINEGFFKNLHA